MATSQTVDLTGLPEPVAQGIRQLVRALHDRQGGTEIETPALRPRTSPEEMERLLDELAAGQTGRVLPPNFSRADIYDDHD